MERLFRADAKEALSEYLYIAATFFKGFVFFCFAPSAWGITVQFSLI